MIMVIGTFTIDADRREAFHTFAREMVVRERQAPGCLRFEIFEDVTTPNRFLMLEQWQDEAALDAHTQTEEFARYEAELNAFLIGDPSFDEYAF